MRDPSLACALAAAFVRLQSNTITYPSPNLLPCEHFHHLLTQRALPLALTPLLGVRSGASILSLTVLVLDPLADIGLTVHVGIHVVPTIELGASFAMLDRLHRAIAVRADIHGGTFTFSVAHGPLHSTRRPHGDGA
jgi:hypothetical protein